MNCNQGASVTDSPIFISLIASAILSSSFQTIHLDASFVVPPVEYTNGEHVKVTHTKIIALTKWYPFFFTSEYHIGNPSWWCCRYVHTTDNVVLILSFLSPHAHVEGYITLRPVAGASDEPVTGEWSSCVDHQYGSRWIGVYSLDYRCTVSLLAILIFLYEKTISILAEIDNGNSEIKHVSQKFLSSCSML